MAMVVSASDPLVSAVQGSVARSAEAQSSPNSSRAVEGGLNRVAFTTKFGPDPVTGDPLVFVAGEDVVAAEEVDFQAIIDRRLGLTSANTLFQASLIGSASEAAGSASPTAARGSDASALPALGEASTAAAANGNTGGPSRGGLVDVQV